MNNPNAKIFDLAAKVGIGCVLLMMVGVLTMFIVENIFLRSEGFAGFPELQPVFVFVVLLLGVCVFTLWIEGWMWAITDWKNRSMEMNIAMILFLLIGPVFAGYILHYFKKHRQRT